MPTHLIITGGTLDKKYDELSGDLVFDESHLPAMLERARFTGEVTTQKLLMKDSLDMTEEDRQLIAGACNETPDIQIVITHGTDTMIETAQTIANMKELGAKTIVLTGAMVPYSFGEKSDALFNLGTALAFAQSLPSGVYVAMNGRHFAHDNVHKDKAAGLFKELS